MVRPVLADTNFPVAELRPIRVLELLRPTETDRLVVVADFDGVRLAAFRALALVFFAIFLPPANSQL